MKIKFDGSLDISYNTDGCLIPDITISTMFGKWRASIIQYLGALCDNRKLIEQYKEKITAITKAAGIPYIRC